MLFLPELSLLGAAVVLFFLSLGQPSAARTKTIATGLAGVTVLCCLVSLKSQGQLFYGAYDVNFFSQFFKLIIGLGTLVLLLFSETEIGVKEESRPEYYLFMCVTVLGLMMLVSSVELLAIFVSLELSSFGVYIMVPMRRSTGEGPGPQVEAGIKYLLFGVMATGLMLFGMSYMYGLTGTTQLSELTIRLANMYDQPAAVISVALVLAGFFYKLALFPLHFWVPDVYEGSANETTAFIAAIPKIAAVALLIRIIMLVDSKGDVLVNVLIVCAVLSMFYGNLSALVQKDVKRLLGFSGISHAGFVLVGIISMDRGGYGTAIYYITGYVFMLMACFLVVCNVSKDGENVRIDDFTGLHKRSPVLAFTLTVGLFALAGIPPFVGFTGKFLLLLGALKKGHLVLVVLAAVNTAVAIYYYLSIVRISYCTDEDNRGRVETDPLMSGLAVALVVIILVMGVFPNTFIDLTTAAVQSIL